nr:hypothetical protein [Tanacetum cinerariifolium]
GNPQMDLQEKGLIDSRCSRHMAGNMSYLTNYEEIDRGYVAFGVSHKSVTKRIVFFNDTECVVLSPDFKLTDENHVLLRVPRKNNMYSVDLMNIIPKGGLACLFAKAISDEFRIWHRRLGHLNFKMMNKLVMGNLVRGLPSKIFENEQTCVACQKGKQHRASCKFDGNADEGFFVGYSLNSKAFRVFNSKTRIVEETLHIRFSENSPNNVGSRPNWLFDIDALTKTMNYQLVVPGIQSNGNEIIKYDNNAGQARKEKEPGKDYILLPLSTADLPFLQEPKNSQDVGFKPSNDVRKKVNEVPRQENECKDQKEKDSVNITNRVNAVSSTISAASKKVNDVGRNLSIELPDDPNMPE